MKAIYKFFSFILVGLLLFPSSVELAHVFLGHQHNFCNHYADAHFHEKNQDCSLFHFQQTSFSTPELISFSVFNPLVEKEDKNNNYNFLGTVRDLAFSRRGPPAEEIV